MIIILTSGKQGSGKTTLSDRLASHYSEQEFHKLRFAQPLYEMHDACRDVLKRYDLDGYDFSKKDGNLLQLLGTEWGRERINQQIWVILLHNKLRTLPEDSIVTVEDCRFENEFDSFSAIPGVIRVRLEAARQSRMRRVSMWRDNENHPSETGLDHYAAMGKFDLTLDADALGQEEVFRVVVERIEQKRTTK